MKNRIANNRPSSTQRTRTRASLWAGMALSCLVSVSVIGCNSSESEEKIIAQDPQAVFTMPDKIKYDVIMPDVAWFGTIIGDRNTGAHGTFIKITKGTGTPAHIHSHAYRGIVLKGIVENPFAGNAATQVKMGPGSYYSVPGGAEHITRCADDSPTDCLTYFYQDTAFDFNPNVAGVDPALGKGAVIVLAKDVKYDVIMPGVAEFGTVYGDRAKGAHGTFVKVVKGKGTPPHKHSKAYHGVVLEGIVENPIPYNQSSPTRLGPGSHYFVPANAEHITRCATNSPTDCKSFIYQEDAFDFIPK